MSSLTVRLEGLDDLIKALDGEPAALRDLLKDALLDGAGIIQAEIELNAPRLTGELAEKGFTTKAGYETKNTVNAVVTITGREFERAFYNEFGVRRHNQPARPFIRPAFDAKREQAAGVVRRKLENRYK